MMRDFGSGGYKAGCSGNPPPLHVYNVEAEAANWFPLERVVLFPQHPGPVMVQIPQPAGAELGDDPTNPAAQTAPRYRTTGMIGWLNVQGGSDR